MGRMLDAFVAYIEERGWPYAVDGDLLSFPAVAENGQWTIYVTAREAEEQLLVHSVLHDLVPADRREAVMELVTRANFGMVLGNWELDLDDGELRFKTSIDIEGVPLTDGLIDPLVMANVAMVDRYLPGVEAVVAGEDPKAAVAAIESA